MATLISHAAVAIALGQAAPSSFKPTVRKWLVAIFCAMLPDIDVLGFYFGVRYGDFWGHRGFTHSLLFAGFTGLLAATALRSSKNFLRMAILLSLITASHGMLDAFTDGGLGIAFFSPWDNERYFFPWRPIEVSPIGAQRFFSHRGWDVLQNELIWVLAPAAVIGSVLYALQKTLDRKG
jgi:inner membrane protein